MISRSGPIPLRDHVGSAYAETGTWRPKVLAAVNSAKSMAKLAVELLYDNAAEGNRAKSDAGAKMTRDEYVALRRSFDSVARYTESGEAVPAA
jgi:hypothetical protein